MHPTIKNLHANDLALKAERTNIWTIIICECMKPYMPFLHELHGAICYQFEIVIQMSVQSVFWLFSLMAVFVGFPFFFLWLLSLGFERCMASVCSYPVFLPLALPIAQSIDFLPSFPKKPIIWVRRRQIGLKNHVKLGQIALDTMGVEATHPLAGGAMLSTLTMIMMSPLRKTCGLKTSTDINGIPLPPHLGNTVTMAAAQEDTPLPVILQMIPGRLVLHDRIQKILPPVQTAVPHHPPHRKDPQIHDLLATETQENTPVIHQATTIAQVDNGGRGNQAHLEGRSLLQVPGHSRVWESSNHNRSKDSSDLHQASKHLPSSQGLSHLRQGSKDNISWDKQPVHNSSHHSNLGNSQQTRWEHLSPQPQLLAWEQVQLSSNLSQVRLQHRQDNSQEDHPQPSQLLLW